MSEHVSETGGMSPIVRIVTQWLLGFIIVFGLAVALFGHLTPGGGFAGGVIVACGFVLATLAFGSKQGPAAWMAKRAASLDAAGALGFLGIAFLGYLSGHFLASWVQQTELFELGSSTFIVLLNLAILLKVGAGLFAGFLAIAMFRVDDDEQKGVDER